MSSDEEVEFGDGGGERKRRTSRAANVSYADSDDHDEPEPEVSEEEEEEDDDDDDSDDDMDDVPLASLKSPSPKKKAKTKASGAKKKKATSASTTKKKKTASSSAKKKKTSASTPKSSGSSEYASPSFALYGSGSKKGELIQKLLCGWWYAISWPDQSSLPNKPPPNYDTMEGFPGVYICTQGDEVGKIKDLRDETKAPNFNNFAKMSSSELRDLLRVAIEEQKRQLIAAEGKGTATEKELDVTLKAVMKIDPAKADREAIKVLKAANLSLPE